MSDTLEAVGREVESAMKESDKRDAIRRDSESHPKFLKHQQISSKEFTKFHSYDSSVLSRRLSANITPLDKSLLSTSVREITLDIFGDAQQVSETDPEDGIYAVVARGPDGKWALYIGSTKNGFYFRFIAHVECVGVKNGDRKPLAVSKIISGWDTMPEMYQIAVTDGNDKLGCGSCWRPWLSSSVGRFKSRRHTNVFLDSCSRAYGTLSRAVISRA
jgi:hypothetical protein